MAAPPPRSILFLLLVETHLVMRESIMAAIPVSSVRRAVPVICHGDTLSSFSTYMRHRPEPLDGVERLLLRLDWLRWRFAHRWSA